MAPLPPNNTGRYFFDYSVGAHEHTALIRANAVVSPAGMGANLNGLLTILAPMLFTTTFTRLRWAASGSNISNTVTSGYEGVTYGTGAPSVDDYPKFLDFVGRAASGRRARFALLSTKPGTSGYRITTAESTVINDAVPVLNGALNAWLAIDGTKPLWYSYVDVGYNAYWQRAVRA